ncbi:hypothetical protein AGMMS50229_04610 [Campylobacterota bacterium]|nr:hypothetical protein AGMMS50229_04610 [Campylobacterota bacterium]
MKKVLLIAVFAVFALMCDAASNKELEAFITSNVARNPTVTFEKFSVVKREKISDLSGWEKVDMELSIKPKGATIPVSQKSSFYTYKNLIAPELIKLEGKSVGAKELAELAKRQIAANPNVKLEDSKLTKRMALKGFDGWESVQMQFNLQVTRGTSTQPISTTDLWFVSKNYVAPDLIDITKSTSLKNSIKGDVTPEYYRPDHLLSGSKGVAAKYKIIVFSDPLCPACRKLLPELIDIAAKNKETVSLYYYHLPTHAESPILMKAAIAAHANNKEIETQMYKTEIKFDNSEDLAVLERFNKLFKTKLTLEAINAPAVLEHYNFDQKAVGELLVNSTPSLFINGVYDEDRKAIGKIIEELGGK